jgi:radical SAM superfamily enzyme YgiQ (UPF0313 family)
VNILIISTNRSANPVPVLPSGACLVADAAEQVGHRVYFLDLMFTDDPLRALKSVLGKMSFDVIGLSVRNIDNIDMGSPRNFIEELIPIILAIRRLTEAHLVLGGASLMVMPAEILRATGVSCAVIGDGPSVFPRLVDRLARKVSWEDLPGIASFVDGEYRINTPAFPVCRTCRAPNYNRWLNMKAYRCHLTTIPLQTKQGCRFQCVYCTYRKIEGSDYHLLDPESVAEATQRYSSSGFDDIEFVDNVFNSPYDHAIAVCESLIRSKNRARLQSIDLNPVSFDHNLLSTMERAGFVGIGITVESASDPVLKALRKGFTAREVVAAAEVVNRNRLPCLWIFLLGGPGETTDTVKETIRFAEKFIRPQDAAFFNIGIRIYPGTELETIARRQGVLSLPSESMLAPIFYTSPDVNAGWIMEQVKQSMNKHMNFMNGDSLSFFYLPQINRLGHRLGLKTPLWQYTRFIRRGLRSLGLRV